MTFWWMYAFWEIFKRKKENANLELLQDKLHEKNFEYSFWAFKTVKTWVQSEDESMDKT